MWGGSTNIQRVVKCIIRKRCLTWRTKSCLVAKDDLPALFHLHDSILCWVLDYYACKEYSNSKILNLCGLGFRQSPWLSWHALSSMLYPFPLYFWNPCHIIFFYKFTTKKTFEQSHKVCYSKTITFCIC